MLIKGAMLHYALFLEGLKKRVDSCIHVKKAHNTVNLTKVDSSGGMLPDILLRQRLLKCKQV